MKRPLKAIIPGDILHVHVPRGVMNGLNRRFLEPGTYRLHVTDLAAKSRSERTFHCYYRPDNLNKEIKVHLRVTIPESRFLQGVLFLGNDGHPVQFKHETNLLRRLVASVKQGAKR